MWGADDPDDRKPMVWGDLRYDDETADPLGRTRRRDRVAPDTALFRVYHELIALRKEHLRLFVDGALHWLRTDDAGGVLVYDRVLGGQRAIVAFNVSDSARDISVPGDGTYRIVFPLDGRRSMSGEKGSWIGCQGDRRPCGFGMVRENHGGTEFSEDARSCEGRLLRIPFANMSTLKFTRRPADTPCRRM